MNENNNPFSRNEVLAEWIKEDLQKSWLTLSDFPITLLETEEQLNAWIHRTTFAGRRILDIGAYAIKYLNVLNYHRLRLRAEIDGCRYLSPDNSDIHIYIPHPILSNLERYKGQKLIIVEGEKKAALLAKLGYFAIAIAGVWMFSNDKLTLLPELEEFILSNMVREYVICFDSEVTIKHDIAQAELRLAVMLLNEFEIESHSIRIPRNPNHEKTGIDDYIIQCIKELKDEDKETKAKETLQTLLNLAQPTFGICFHGDIIPEYVIREISSITSPVHCEAVVKRIAKKAGVSVEVVRESVQLERTKKEKVEESEKEESEPFTQKEIDKAKELLKSPNILEKMIDLTTKRGYVGEEINKKMLFLSFTSRRLRNSISTVVKGASASGKSALVNSILSLIPKGEALSYSFLTPKALVHFTGDLSHKILFIQEHSGSKGADYSIRTTISEGEISIAIPVKDETTGNFTTIEKRIPAAGLVFVETTTSERVHVENQTRVFDLYMDESQNQTQRVLDAESEREDELDAELEAEAKIWRAAQTLIENHKVHIPYRKKLVEVFPKDKIRVRRDFQRFLSLIKVHVLLFQFQRQKDAEEGLIATKEDLEAILPLAEVILVQSHKEVSPKLEKVLKTVEKEFGVNREFSFGELENKVEFKERTLRDHLKKLTDSDFLSHNGKTGKESRYTLLFPLASIASISNFGARCRKLLENFEANSDSPQSASSPQSDAGRTDRGNGANRGENGFASKNANDDSELNSETPSEAKRQKESNTPHSEACDCRECCPESDFSGDRPEARSEPKSIIYKTDDDMFQVIFTGEDGRQLIHIITPDCSEFEQIRNDYEQQRSE